MGSVTLSPARATLALALLLLSPFVAPLALASPYGTSYTATVVNFPGSATGTLEFDGVEEPLGTSGLLVGESSTSFSGFELLEFSLRTANGAPFVGQQLAPTDPASVEVSDLFWFGDTNPAAAIAMSAFLWLTIDGAPQALSDVLNVGFVFGTHPLDLTIPVLFVDNVASTTFGFGTFGESAFDVFGLLVGPTVAAQINDVHFGLAAAPVVVPEPGTGLLLSLGLFGPLLRRSRTRRLVGLLACYALAGFAWSGTLGCPDTRTFGFYGRFDVTATTNDPALGADVTYDCSYLDPNGNVVRGCPTGPANVNSPYSHQVCATATPAAALEGWHCNLGLAFPCNSTLACDGPNQCEFDVPRNGFVRCEAYFCTSYPLNVSVTGAGTVTSDPGPGSQIDCSAGSQGTCVASYCLDVNGDPAVVTLTPTARPGSGHVFAGWSGDPDCDDGVVSGIGVSCEATFRQPLLSVAATGSGRVSANLSGVPLDCRETSPPASCSGSVATGGSALLSALPDPGAQFVSWGGDCPDGFTSSTVVMDGDKSCTAEFSVAAGGVGVNEIVSLADDESRGNLGVQVSSITDEQLSGSADLSVVAFRSFATNLLATTQPGLLGYARDRTAGTTRRIVDQNASPSAAQISLSADGFFAAYEYVDPDPNLGFEKHVYRRDLRTDQEVQISVYDPAAEVSGTGTDPVISGNGRFVAYRTVIEAGSRFGVAVRDTCTGALPPPACTPHSVAVSYDPDDLPLDSIEGLPRISRDGRFVLFRGVRQGSASPELFLRDRDTDGNGVFDEVGLVDTIEVAPDPTGGMLDLSSALRHDLDASGRYVAFETKDTDLPGNPDPQPTYGRAWLRDTCAGAPPSPPCAPRYTLLSVRADGTPIDDVFNGSFLSDLSASGRYVAFYGGDTLLVGTDDSVFNYVQQSVLRDTCVGAPATPACTARNLLISRTDPGSGAPFAGGALIADAILPQLSDDGSGAVFFGPRSAVPPPDSVPTRVEVLFAVTEIVTDSGGVPVLTNRSPGNVTAGSPELLLTITGSGFVPGSQVLWRPQSLPAQPRDAIFISPTKLQLRLLQTELATATVFTFKVLNPGGSPSANQLSFRVN